MEAKLREYRALRRRKELIDNAKEKLETTKQKLVDLLTPKIFKDMEKKEDEVLLLEDKPESSHAPPLQIEEVDESDTIDEEKQESWQYFITKWTIYAIIWISLYLYFLNLGFGAVFFVISALIGICLNTRTRKRKKGEVSAYSVFNENCVSIDGTLKAEQFEAEIRYGPGTVRML